MTQEQLTAMYAELLGMATGGVQDKHAFWSLMRRYMRAHAVVYPVLSPTNEPA